MGSQIPSNANFKNLSCQLGGLRLNGKVDYNDPSILGGTAESYTVITIDDTDSLIEDTKSFAGKYIRIKVGNTGDDSVDFYYIPLYQ
jgi:hypothetical protein